MEKQSKVNILGCPFSVISFEETINEIRNAVHRNYQLRIVTANVDFVMKARRDPVFAAELMDADLVVADGVPILWAGSILRHPLKGRVNGTDLVWKCAELSHRIKCGIALVGAKFAVAQRAMHQMLSAFKEAEIHAIPTPYPLGEKENRAVVEEIRKTGAKVVLVALGAPKQERWINANLNECGANVGIGIGSAFDIISGDKPRAPGWMRNNGLEWLHRLILEPRRLTRRYILEDSPFFFHLLVETLRRKERTDARR